MKKIYLKIKDEETRILYKGFTDSPNVGSRMLDSPIISVYTQSTHNCQLAFIASLNDIQQGIVDSLINDMRFFFFTQAVLSTYKRLYFIDVNKSFYDSPIYKKFKNTFVTDKKFSRKVPYIFTNKSHMVSEIIKIDIQKVKDFEKKMREKYNITIIRNSWR